MANEIPSGAFVTTTNVWDVQALYDTDINTPAFKELLVRLYQNVNNIANVLNLKDTGYYLQQPFVTGQLYFPNIALNSSTAASAEFRPVWRYVVVFGQLPNAGSKSVPHGLTINSATTNVGFYAECTDTTGLKYITLPYASASGIDNIQLDWDATNVTITTASDRRNFNICNVVLEYLTF